MNRDDMLDLFDAIISADSRREFGEKDLDFWLRIARHANWTRNGALDAVVAYASEKTRWISPADITAYLRSPGQTGERICEY